MLRHSRKGSASWPPKCSFALLRAHPPGIRDLFGYGMWLQEGALLSPHAPPHTDGRSRRSNGLLNCRILFSLALVGSCEPPN